MQELGWPQYGGSDGRCQCLLGIMFLAEVRWARGCIDRVCQSVHFGKRSFWHVLLGTTALPQPHQAKHAKTSVCQNAHFEYNKPKLGQIRTTSPTCDPSDFGQKTNYRGGIGTNHQNHHNWGHPSLGMILQQDCDNRTRALLYLAALCMPIFQVLVSLAGG